MSVIKSFIIISLFTILKNIDAQDTEAVQFIDHPHKNEYILQQPGTDKHKYGYELKENKHFHHTTTELDGVRLGCYGYSLKGKKYSTQYVADIKGYRPVYTYDVIEVYPRSGGTREATFVGNFDEDDKKSENIRYFFPEGCRGDDSMVILPPEENPMKPPVPIIPARPPTPKPTTPKPKIITTPKVQIKEPPVVSIATPRIPDPIITTPPPPLKIVTPPVATPPPEKYLPPAKTYLPPSTPAPKGNYITKALPTPPPYKPIIQTTPAPFKPIIQTTPAPYKPIVQKTPAPYNPVKTTPAPAILKKDPVKKPEAPKNTCDAKSCCNEDDSLPKLVIPIKLDEGKSGSCARYAKLTVPADSVGMEALKTLLSNPTQLAKTIIKSLA